MALFAQIHKDWGCLVVLSPQTSNVAYRVHEGLLSLPCSGNGNDSRYLTVSRG